MVKRIIILGLLISASFAQAQIFFSDDFNDGNVDGWTNIDNDADPTMTPGVDADLWYAADTYAGFVTGSDGAAAVSHSLAYDYSASDWVSLNPNNFLISPSIDLSSALPSDLKLKFDAGSGQATGFHAEHYAVYVTTSNTITDIEAATPVFEETLPIGEQMFSHVIDISSYSGQTVYVTIRHFNCTGQFVLLIDNVVVEQVFNNNAIVESLSLNRYSLTNIDNTLGVNVTNNGANNITSVTIDWNDGTSHSSTITGLNIAQFSSTFISHPIFVNYANVLEKEITVNITNVNGEIDPDVSDNSASILINTISQQSQKRVLIEEGTGTWCPSCPRGTVMMDNMTSAHPDDLVGIAVHVGSDPMVVSEYETNADFFGAPTIHVDRTYLDQNVDDAESLFNQQITLDVPAELSATISGAGNTLSIETSAIFRTMFSNADFRIGVIIVEDHVTGTGSAYDQNNAYAGGAYGDMGEFDNLPDPVPADQMEYNHVGRALLGGFSGQLNSVPTSINDGDEVTYTFNYTIPSSSDIENMHAVVVLIDQSTNQVVNVASAFLNSVGINTINTIETSIYPNPTSDIINVKLNGVSENYTISIIDINGKIVLQKKFDASINNAAISIKGLNKGNYFINISNNTQSTTQKIVIL